MAVKVDASQFEGWFYEGAGIYRHVWLVKTTPLAIAPDGIFVYSQFKDNCFRASRWHRNQFMQYARHQWRRREVHWKSSVRKANPSPPSEAAS